MRHLSVGQSELNGNNYNHVKCLSYVIIKLVPHRVRKFVAFMYRKAVLVSIRWRLDHL